jgi:hypothetical protein
MGSAGCHTGKYQVEINFKDGKFKFNAIKFESYMPSVLTGSAFMSGGWVENPIKGTVAQVYFDKKGNIKEPYRTLIAGIGNEFILLTESLYSYLSDAEKVKASDNWWIYMVNIRKSKDEISNCLRFFL